MIWVCKTILSDGLDKCYFLQKNVEVLITPTIILEPKWLKVNSWGKTSSKCFAPAFLIGLNKTHKNKLK